MERERHQRAPLSVMASDSSMGETLCSQASVGRHEPARACVRVWCWRSVRAINGDRENKLIVLSWRRCLALSGVIHACTERACESGKWWLSFQRSTAQ